MSRCVALQPTLFSLLDACSDLNSADVVVAAADEAGKAAEWGEDMAARVRRNRAVSLNAVRGIVGL